MEDSPNMGKKFSIIFLIIQPCPVMITEDREFFFKISFRKSGGGNKLKKKIYGFRAPIVGLSICNCMPFKIIKKKVSKDVSVVATDYDLRSDPIL